MSVLLTTVAVCAILSANSFSNAFIFSLAIMLGSNACAVLKSSIASFSFPSFR
jgi:hypothetical protein